MAAETDVETELNRSLESIEDAANRICAGVDLFDPDALLTELHDAQQPVEDALARLMGDAAPADTGVELTRLAHDAARGALAELGFVLRLEVVDRGAVWAPVGLAVAETLLGRLIAVGIQHAGPGGSVTLVAESTEEGGRIRLDASVSVGAYGATTLPPTYRCASLDEFASEHGCELAWTDLDGTLSAELTFPKV